jgi:hypothetical protein
MNACDFGQAMIYRPNHNPLIGQVAFLRPHPCCVARKEMRGNLLTVGSERVNHAEGV